MKKKQIILRVDPDLHRELSAHSKRVGVSVNEIVIRLIAIKLTEAVNSKLAEAFNSKEKEKVDG